MTLAWRITSATKLKNTRISHTYNGSSNACVRREKALKSQAYYLNGQERYLTWDGWVFIGHTPKTICWEDSVHFTVGPQYNSWSNRQGCNCYFQIKFLTVGGAGGLTGHGGSQTVNNTEADGQTTLEQGLAVWLAPSGGQTVRKSLSSRKDYSKDFNDSSLETTQKSLWTKEKNGGAHSEFWTTFSQE
jgi:hypothetical protein